MNGRFLVRAVLAIVVVATLIGLGVYVYDAGVAQGIAEGTRVTVREPAAGTPSVAPYGYHYPYGPWFRPFGFFHLLVPLLGFFLIFALLRAFIWRPYRGWHGDWDRGPSRLEDWHRRAHESETPKTE
jgi:hypothetical protein